MNPRRRMVRGVTRNRWPRRGAALAVLAAMAVLSAGCGSRLSATELERAQGSLGPTVLAAPALATGGASQRAVTSATAPVAGAVTGAAAAGSPAGSNGAAGGEQGRVVSAAVPAAAAAETAGPPPARPAAGVGV